MYKRYRGRQIVDDLSLDADQFEIIVREKLWRDLGRYLSEQPLESVPAVITKRDTPDGYREGSVLFDMDTYLITPDELQFLIACKSCLSNAMLGSLRTRYPVEKEGSNYL